MPIFLKIPRSRYLFNLLDLLIVLWFFCRIRQKGSDPDLQHSWKGKFFLLPTGLLWEVALLPLNMDELSGAISAVAKPSLAHLPSREDDQQSVGR